MTAPSNPVLDFIMQDITQMIVRDAHGSVGRLWPSVRVDAAREVEQSPRGVGVTDARWVE
jgi:hypothetical protein